MLHPILARLQSLEHEKPSGAKARKRPAPEPSFAAHGSMPGTDLSLQLTGLGSLARPLSAAEAARLHAIEWQCRCADCETVRRWAESASAQPLEMPMAEDRRQHVAQQLKAAAAPLGTDIIRTGRPYKLRLGKPLDLLAQERGQRERWARELQRLEDAEDAADYEHAVAADDGVRFPSAVAYAIADGAHPVKAWREHKGLTLQALADAAGLSKPFLSQIEGGKRTGSMATLKKLANAVGVPVGALLT